MKFCHTCQSSKTLDEFQDAKGKNGKTYKCRECKACTALRRNAIRRAKYASNPEVRAKAIAYNKAHPEMLAKSKRKSHWKNLGIADPELAYEYYEKHDGKCEICRNVCETGKNLAMDHNHQTGEIRGMLCNLCNRGLGLFKDNPELLTKAIEYLNKI